MKKSLIMGAMLLVAAVSFAADKVIDLSTPAAWANNHVKAGKGAKELSVKVGTQIIAKELIPVDAKHTYNFNGSLYVPAGKIAGISYTGFLLYDKNKKLIAQINAVTPKGSTTELVAAVAKGSKVLKIKANKQWKAIGHYYVGFNVKDGKICRDISSSAIQSIKNEGGNMIVTLKAPLRKAYAAGTKVRIQVTGAYFYSGVYAVKAKPTGFGKALKQNQFWAETAYIRPMILVNWSLKKGMDRSKLETVYKDMKVTVKEIK